tara:strand:- start:84 stop:665 length:582 start_codon:yes stop_codon:yes gene_type:complete
MHLAVYSHFDGKYDMVKYGASGMRISNESYLKKGNRVLYERLATKYNSTKLLLLVFHAKLNADTNNIANVSIAMQKDSEEYLRKFTRIDSRFQEDMENILYAASKKGLTFKDMLINKDGHPPLLKIWLSGGIERETMVILDHYLKLFNIFDRNMKDDFTWNVERVKFIAYRDVLIFDTDMIKKKLSQILNKLK